MRFTTLAMRMVGRTLILSLNRPDRLNAFTPVMADELERFFGDVSHDDDVAAIVLTGAGDAFCAGMDLSASGNVFGLNDSLEPTLADLDERFDDPILRNGVRDTGGRVTLAIHECRKPVIAAINGVAVGIGATMTLAAHFRLAGQSARMGFVFASIGIVPEGCSTWFLPRIVGPSAAMELVLTGDIIPATQAERIGLVRSVHADDALLDAAVALADRITRDRSPVAIAITRQMMRRNAAEADPLAAHKIESLGVFYTQRDDGREGVAAFLDKRTARFASRASELPAFYPWW